MSVISDEGRKLAQNHLGGARLLPQSDECAPHLLGASASWGPFVEGDHVTICVHAECYLCTGVSSVVASCDDIVLPAGRHNFVVPTGVTHVALFSEAADAKGAVWRS